MSPAGTTHVAGTTAAPTTTVEPTTLPPTPAPFTGVPIPANDRADFDVTFIHGMLNEGDFVRRMALVFGVNASEVKIEFAETSDTTATFHFYGSNHTALARAFNDLTRDQRMAYFGITKTVVHLLAPPPGPEGSGTKLKWLLIGLGGVALFVGVCVFFGARRKRCKPCAMCCSESDDDDYELHLQYSNAYHAEHVTRKHYDKL